MLCDAFARIASRARAEVSLLTSSSPLWRLTPVSGRPGWMRGGWKWARAVVLMTVNYHSPEYRPVSHQIGPMPSPGVPGRYAREFTLPFEKPAFAACNLGWYAASDYSYVHC